VGLIFYKNKVISALLANEVYDVYLDDHCPSIRTYLL